MPTVPAGWYPQPDGNQRYWDGSAWTEHVAGNAALKPHGSIAPAPAAPSPVSRERLAHDLAMTYLANRYGAKVVGEFAVSADQDWSGNALTVTDVTGGGEVRTEVLPHVSKARMKVVEVKTGGRYLFGLGSEKTAHIEVEVQPREYEIDTTFKSMISDYYAAYARLLELLPR